MHGYLLHLNYPNNLYCFFIATFVKKTIRKVAAEARTGKIARDKSQLADHRSEESNTLKT